MAWCLIPKLANEFLNALRDGRLDPAKLAEMTSEERAILAAYISEQDR